MHVHVGMSRAGLYKEFAHLGYTKGAEIGVWLGANAKVMLDTIPNLSLALVDPYSGPVQYDRQAGRSSHDKAEQHAHRLLAQFKKAVFIRATSQHAAASFADGSMDFVYIDGNHRYDMCMLDIILWLPKVKVGGIISGHDYESSKSRQFGVQLAVDDYARSHRLSVEITDRAAEPKGQEMPSWFWTKQANQHPFG